jgi:hypothetical protein
VLGIRPVEVGFLRPVEVGFLRPVEVGFLRPVSPLALTFFLIIFALIPIFTMSASRNNNPTLNKSFINLYIYKIYL